MNGNEILVALGGKAAGNVIGSAKSCELSVNGETIEISSATNATSKSFLAGRYDWTVNLSYLVTDVTDHTLAVGTEYTLYIGHRNGSAIGSTYLTGSAILKTCKITANRGHLIQGTITFQGNGPLSDT